MAERAADYEARAARCAADADTLRRRGERLTAARLATFLLAAVFAVVAWTQAPPLRGIAIVAAVMCGAVFSRLVTQDRRLRRECLQLRRLSELNQRQAARVRRQWNRLPPLRLPELKGDLATAGDLDLFGHASLAQLLSNVGSPSARATLAAWLLAPADVPEIVRRQVAVSELAPQLDWRQGLEVRAVPLADHDPDSDPFIAWAEGPCWLHARPMLWTLVLATPLLSLVVGLAAYAGLIAPGWWMLPLVVGLTVSFFGCGRVHAVFNQVAQREGAVAHYAELFAWAATASTRCPKLESLGQALRAQGTAADAALDHLHRAMELGELRFSPMVWLPLQFFTLWDFHVLALVERWQRRHGHAVRGWFAALGELETLAALAGLRHDEPAWCFPEFTADAPRLAGRALAHPLLAGERRVANDVELGPPGSFLLVTGSNMSGKSTLLRSIGANVVLAQCGGPVCAAALELPPLEVASSMRVQDSLEDGVSFFLAELKRLKEIVDRAQGAAGSPRVLLYLLDEILQGTNSAERQTAVREVVGHLLRCRALGAVTTHDLHLADAEPLRSCSRQVHFREQVDRDQHGAARMTFDYQLRPGGATTTNALRLLELIGLRAVPQIEPKSPT
ncbi:MAG: DNA mismatch repair protein [Pirellulales bacterium]|nr:DNA mismatch repair protein [Pirellulales bacterium]